MDPLSEYERLENAEMEVPDTSDMRDSDSIGYRELINNLILRVLKDLGHNQPAVREEAREWLETSFSHEVFSWVGLDREATLEQHRRGLINTKGLTRV